MKNIKDKILILVPAFTARGGITNYYHVLREEFPWQIEYFERGSRTWPIRKGFFSELLRAYKDYLNFKKRITDGDISLVQSSTSLGVSTTIRDGLFLRYAHKKGIKTIVFFRGWDVKAENKTEKNYLSVFRYFFFSADAFITLSEHTCSTLKRWGYKRKIYIETTLVDKHLIKDVKLENINLKKFDLNQNQTLNILFLSRIEKRKGIYELLEAFKLLKSDTLPYITLTICGDGFELVPLQQMIEYENIKGITIKGFISGEEKRDAFANSHIFVFPSHGEGMPNAVLEAMGFGLPIVTTPVGGVIDFFEDGKNGYFTPINNAIELAKNIKKLVLDQNIRFNIAFSNYHLANDRFRSDKVAKRILKIFHEVSEN